MKKRIDWEIAENFCGEYICNECGEMCQPTAVDDGIGPYEFWGAKGNDSNISVVSDCCHAEFSEFFGDE